MALPPIFIQFLGDYTGLRETVDGVKTELAEVDEESSLSMEGLGAVSTGVLLGIGAAAAGAAYEGLKLATSFQQAMMQISTQAGVPKAAIAGLSNDVLNLAGQVGFSPDSLAEALYHIESSFSSVGITSSMAMSLLKVAAEGAAVGGADLTDVTNALDAAIASGIPGVQNYSQAMGALNAIVGSGDMTMQDLANALGTGVLAVVKGYGLSLNDVGAALATFGDNNIRGAQAATDLRMAVQAMQDPVTTAGPIMAKLGINTETLAKTMENGGLLPALELLNQRMIATGTGGKQMSNTLTELVGKKAGSGLDILIGQLSRVQSKYPEIEKAADGFGNAVAQQNTTLTQHINDAKAALDALGIRIGDALLPPLTSFMGVLSKGLAYLSSHTGAFWALAAGIGALTAAMIIAKLATIEWDAVLDASPIMLIAAGIIALGVGVYYAYTHFKSFRDAVQDVWHALETAAEWFDRTVIKSKSLASVLDAVGRAIKTAWNDCWKEVGKAITSFESGPGKSIENTIKQIQQFWHQYGGEITKDAKAVWALIADWVKLYLDIVVAQIKFALDIALDIWRVVWGVIKDFTKLVFDFIANYIRTAVDLILDIVKVFLDLLEGHWNKAFHDAISIFTNLFANLGHMFSTFWSDAGKLLYDAGVNIIKGLVNGITSGFGLIESTMKHLGGVVTNAFHSIMGIFSPSRVMYASGTFVVQGLDNALQDGQEQLRNSASRMGSAITSGFQTAGQRISLGQLQSPSLGTLGTSGGTNVQNVVQLEVQGHVLTDNDLRDLIQKEMLQLGGRNTGTYLPARI